MTLSTVLLVLKIILIVLLSIVGIALVLVLWILFWPYHYKISVLKNDKFDANFNLSFFFHFISVWALMENGLNIKVKVLGITIFDKKKKDAKKESEDKANEVDDLDSFEEIEGYTEDKAKNSDSSNKDDSDKNDSHKKNSCDNTIDKKESEESNVVTTVKSDLHEDASYEESCDETTGDEPKQSIFDRFSLFLDSLSDKIDKLLDKISDTFQNINENVEEKVQKLIDTITYYENLFSKKGTRIVINYLKIKLIKLLKALKPYKAKVSINYGSVEPDKVGKMYELYSLMYPFLPKKSGFNADYESDHLEADVWIKGYFNLGYICILILQVILNKKVKRFIKLVKREQ